MISESLAGYDSLPTIEVPNIDFMKKVGPEPLEADFTKQQFIEQFKRRAKTNIKAAILDQTVIAGVGNIYADESLWGAKIHPKRLVGSVTDDEFKLLYHELRDVNLLHPEKVARRIIPISIRNQKGSYMDFARVFRREGLTCPRPDILIEKIRVAGRGTHICPVCQMEAKEMITLLTGENGFEIERALKRIVTDFEGTPEKIDGSELELRQVPDLLMGVSLFADKRLLIIKNLSENKAVWADFGDWLERVSDDIHLVLVEPKPDKRTRTYKDLQKAAEVKEFKA